MQATEEAVSATPTPETPPEPNPMDQVIGLLQSMSAQIQALGARVEAVETSGPRFVPSTPETYSADNERYQIAEMAPTDRVPRSKTVPITSDGLRIPEAFLEEHPSRFGSGSWVRLNLDAVPHGRADGKTRGELMVEAGTVNAPGEVIDRTFLSKVRRADGRRGVWKYRIKFPREVMPGSNQGIVNLHEPELVPA